MTLGSLMAGMVLIVLFVFHQSRAQQALLPLRLLASTLAASLFIFLMAIVVVNLVASCRRSPS
jgi:hypothetical protein